MVRTALASYSVCPPGGTADAASIALRCDGDNRSPDLRNVCSNSRLVTDRAPAARACARYSSGRS